MSAGGARKRRRAIVTWIEAGAQGPAARRATAKQRPLFRAGRVCLPGSAAAAAQGTRPETPYHLLCWRQAVTHYSGWRSTGVRCSWSGKSALSASDPCTKRAVWAARGLAEQALGGAAPACEMSISPLSLMAYAAWCPSWGGGDGGVAGASAAPLGQPLCWQGAAHGGWRRGYGMCNSYRCNSLRPSLAQRWPHAVEPTGAAGCSAASPTSRVRRWNSARLWSWEIRDLVTQRTSAISLNMRFCW